jgi:hypothetical protein
MEALAIIVGFAGVVVGSVLTYLFTRSHYERKRQDDLADREFSRRLTAKDKRISDAQDYLNAYLEITRTMMKVELGLAITRDSDKHQPEYDSIMEMTKNLTANRMLSVFQLGDSELPLLNVELILLTQKEYANTVDLMLAVRKKETINQEATLARIETFSRRTGTLIGAIQLKLNSLTEKV